jgi:two-component system chemotaxis response regulator CheY
LYLVIGFDPTFAVRSIVQAERAHSYQLPITKYQLQVCLLCRLEFAGRIPKEFGMAEPPSALIIDDEPHVRVFLRTLLKVAGVGEVWEAGTGPTGLEAYGQYKPSITLLDLSMPGPTGMEILPLIMKHDPDAMVVIMTSLNDRQIVLECQRLGATGFLLKSRPKDELLAALKEFLSEASEA